MRPRLFVMLLSIAVVLGIPAAKAQINTLTREQLIKYTAKSPYERFPDGRPKVPDALLERFKKMCTEEINQTLPGAGFKNQFDSSLQVLHPDRVLVGRALTVQFMPSRPDITEVQAAEAKTQGNARAPRNQTAIDMLGPNDVIVVDLFGSENPFAGNKLAYYIMKAAGTGMVVDGNIYWMQRIADMDLSVYFRHSVPQSPGTSMLTGINVPVRIGNTTVLPGDVVFGDREGVTFIPPHMAEQVIKTAESVRVRDDWTMSKFNSGKYKSTEIYGVTDPALLKERDEYIKQHEGK